MSRYQIAVAALIATLVCFIDTPRLGAAEPASAADAAKVIDLLTFAPVGKDPKFHDRVIASQQYDSEGSSSDIFKELQKALTKAGWKELQGTYIDATMSSASFSKAGFVISVSMMPSSEAGRVLVSLRNLGNVEFDKLAFRKSMKPIFSSPLVGMYQSSASAEETRKSIRESMLKDGWEPFGEVIGSEYFRKAAVKLLINVSEAPAQGNKTMVQVSSEQLSVSLPFPQPTKMLQYTDIQTTAMFDVVLPPAEVWDFYRKKLGEQGWAATTENPITIDFRDLTIFRNKAKELIEVSLHEFEGATRGIVKYQTALQVEDENKRAQEFAKAAKAGREMKEAAKEARDKTELIVRLPKGTRVAETDDKKIEIAVANGKAQKLASMIVAIMKDAGWEVEERISKSIVGDYELTKDDFTLHLDYQDPGIIPPTLEITVFGAGTIKAEVAE